VSSCNSPKNPRLQHNADHSFNTEVLTAVVLKIQVFWSVMLCRWTFKGTVMHSLYGLAIENNTL
jgi:hypothetical protein